MLNDNENKDIYLEKYLLAKKQLPSSINTTTITTKLRILLISLLKWKKLIFFLEIIIEDVMSEDANVVEVSEPESNELVIEVSEKNGFIFKAWCIL